MTEGIDRSFCYMRLRRILAGLHRLRGLAAGFSTKTSTPHRREACRRWAAFAVFEGMLGKLNGAHDGQSCDNVGTRWNTPCTAISVLNLRNPFRKAAELRMQAIVFLGQSTVTLASHPERV